MRQFVRISEEGEKFLRNGQMWMYRNNVVDLDESIENGAVVNILTMNDEYIGTTGIIPSFAIPAANPNACCSAIPMSKNLLGNSCANFFKPVPSFIDAVTATILSFVFARSTNLSPNTLE